MAHKLIDGIEIKGVTIGGIAVYWENDPHRMTYGSVTVSLRSITINWNTRKSSEETILFGDRFTPIKWPESAYLSTEEGRKSAKMEVVD